MASLCFSLLLVVLAVCHVTHALHYDLLPEELHPIMDEMHKNICGEADMPEDMVKDFNECEAQLTTPKTPDVLANLKECNKKCIESDVLDNESRHKYCKDMTCSDDCFEEAIVTILTTVEPLEEGCETVLNSFNCMIKALKIEHDIKLDCAHLEKYAPKN